MCVLCVYVCVCVCVCVSKYVIYMRVHVGVSVCISRCATALFLDGFLQARMLKHANYVLMIAFLLLPAF